MIKWKKIVKESGNGIKKLLKMNGVTKFPSGMVFSDTEAKWSKHRGHAGSNTIRNMCIQLDHAGWKRGDWRTGGIPDGSSVANANNYISPDGRITMSYTEYYGSTAYDNSFYITFKLVGDGMVNESSRFGFKVGDKVALTKDKSNQFSGDFIPAGSQGEVVAIDKPMPGVIKVKIEDWKVISVPERQLRMADDDEEPWRKLAKKPKEEPKRDVRPEKPEDYYMRPTTYGSPRFTGD